MRKADHPIPEAHGSAHAGQASGEGPYQAQQLAAVVQCLARYLAPCAPPQHLGACPAAIRQGQL